MIQYFTLWGEERAGTLRFNHSFSQQRQVVEVIVRESFARLLCRLGGI
jgi:hypothetical protein